MPAPLTTAENKSSPVLAISGTGSALPERCFPNSELEKYLDTSDAWISERVGIKSRYICAEHESCLSLAADAGSKAMTEAGLEPADIDIVIFATVTADQLLPSAAACLSHRLGINNAMSFDVTAACSGFLFALATADALLDKLGSSNANALIIGAETLSRVIDWKDRNTAVLFGDGAGACILHRSAQTESPIISSYLKTDASGAEFIQRKSSGFPSPSAPATASDRITKNDSPFLNMAGREVFKSGVKHMTHSIEQVLQKSQISIDQIKLFIPHQSNARMIQSVCQNIGLSDPDKIGMNIDRVGNTSAASIPIALDEYVRAGTVKPGDYVLLTAVGSGMTYGSLLLRW